MAEWGTRHQALLLPASLIVRGLDAGSAARPLSYAFSILRLGFSTVAGFRSGYAVRILLGDSRVAGARVSCSGSLTIAANGFATPVLDAISGKQTRSN